MESKVETKPSLRERLIDELKEFTALTLYLYVCFAALIYFKAAILQTENIHYAPLGVAVVKAAICAKFMLMGRMIHLGERFKTHPLIVPTIYKSLVFLVLLFVLTVIEEIVVGLIHGRSVTESVSEIAGGTWVQLLATSAVMVLVLMPYFAFRILGELVGDRHLVRLYFHRRR